MKADLRERGWPCKKWMEAEGSRTRQEKWKKIIKALGHLASYATIYILTSEPDRPPTP